MGHQSQLVAAECPGECDVIPPTYYGNYIILNITVDPHAKVSCRLW